MKLNTKHGEGDYREVMKPLVQFLRSVSSVPLKEKGLSFLRGFFVAGKFHEKEGNLGFAVFVSFCAFLWRFIRLRLCCSGPPWSKWNYFSPRRRGADGEARLWKQVRFQFLFLCNTIIWSLRVSGRFVNHGLRGWHGWQKQLSGFIPIHVILGSIWMRLAALCLCGSNFLSAQGIPRDSEKSPSGSTLTKTDLEHWAFQRVQRPALPALAKGQSAVIHPIDRFILARLEAEVGGASFSRTASRETLIRRAAFDLTGLPPSPSEIDEFVSDSASDAYAKLIDRLLASPRYGERWGRHWLDLARYAETDGFEHDAARPHSWRYRDYVIRSFNEDKPYERFVREQVAGDELWPDSPEALIATGFNLLGPDMVDSSDQVQRRHNTLNDMTDTTALTFLGLTLACARCHDHKFEPLFQEDYYKLQACFAPSVFRRDQTVATTDERTAFEAAMKRFDEHPKVRALADLEAPAWAQLREFKLSKLSPEARSAHLTPPAKRNAEQANLVLETESMVVVSEKELAEAFTRGDRERRAGLLEEIKMLPKPAPLPKALALVRAEGLSPRTHVLRRGDYTQPGKQVEAGFPSVLNPPPVESFGTRGGRSALANWLVSPHNPLTARVMMNRLWQHHFGRGLVPTPSDFGTHGQRPTHPELLDWLAAEFMDGGWKIKRMHKLMMLSAAYRQISQVETPAPALVRADPANRLYWRMNRQRLEGEAIRDSLLAISGELNLQMGGPGVYPPIPEDIFKGASGWMVSKDPRDRVRRSVYIFARRNLRFPFLEVFDAPDNNLSCPGREQSTTAPQALTLLNTDEVISAALATTRRLTHEAAGDGKQIVPLFRLTLGRPPTEKELAVTREFLARSPLNELCRALFNLNSFVYVD